MPATASMSTAKDDTPAKTLLDLHKTGRLTAEYPRVMGLLSRLSGTELINAGQILSRLQPDDVLREHPAIPVVTVAVTGHGTLSVLVPALTAELARHGLLMRPFVANFDSYAFDLADPASPLYTAGPDIVLCVLDPCVVFDEVPTPWRPEDVERVAEEKLRLLAHLSATFEATGRGTLILNTLPLPHRFAAQLVDHCSRARLGAVWREANARLLRMASEHPAVYVFDLDPLIAEGIPASDTRLSVYAKAHLSPDLLARYACQVAHLARHIAGRTKKCLVLDLDETLWGGTVGEDGVAGIEVADSYRGMAFRAFQQVIKQVGSQGVLLAAVSKNDLEPVQEALRDHPRMILREEDFVRITANWRPKHENLTDLAEALNLGIDSFVFVDDSGYECELVRSTLPQVTVIQLDDEPARHVERLLRDGWFDALELTTEDRARIGKYREELARKDFLDNFDTIEDYLRGLEIKVRLARASESDMARISQITLRTNQFNLTTRRLQPSEVRELIQDRAAQVLAIHASDRFGDNGIVGAVFTRRTDSVVHIENFLLSCRVFSRGIESACMSALLRDARAAGANAILGAYRPTSRNGLVKDFYPRYGFKLISADDTVLTFRHDLAEIVTQPGHIHLVDDLEENAS